jgi:ferrous iron transport protein B
LTLCFPLGRLSRNTPKKRIEQQMKTDGIIEVALAGNPNSGKTTLFNNLTGTRQHVGNYPGVTVEKKEGRRRHGAHELRLVDLPGTYSLTAYSLEEVVARRFILEERPDVVVDVVDASNVERHLYLATQLLELNVPLVLAFNMSDIAQAQGIEFDLQQLSDLLGAPIVPTVGNKNQGSRELLDAIVAVATGAFPRRVVEIPYGKEIEDKIAPLAALLEQDSIAHDQYHARWLALKLLERDVEVQKLIHDPVVAEAAESSAQHIEKVLGDAPEALIADRRYGFISGACQGTVRATVETRHTLSDKIDAVVTNRVLGFPLFLLLMYLAFYLTFTIGQYPMDWIENFFGATGELVNSLWAKGSDSPLRALLVDGVISGVGGVLIFLPNIMLLFAAVVILEDSGYMARAAFIMDQLMHKIGLHGKSFLPMLMGFGCSVPAIMATRTIETRRARLTTMMIIPLMSCSARLPIYALIIPAFFPQAWQAPMLWLMYVIGIAVAVVLAKLLRSTVFRGETMPLVMELPPYRIPTIKGILIHTWEQAWEYVKKAGTIILGISIVLWALNSYPKKTQFDVDYDASAAQAEHAYLERTAQLHALIDIPSPSLLVETVKAELAMREEQGRYHEHEPQYAAAREQYETRLNELTRTTNGQGLARFLEAVDKVEAARETFQDAVQEAGVKKDSLRYMALDSHRDAIMASLERTFGPYYEAAVTYLDKARTPFLKHLEQLDQSRKAEQMAYSVTGRVGHAIDPAIRPLGFDWRIGTALVSAFAAKEVFVAQMGIIFAVGEADEASHALRTRLRASYTPLTGFCVMLFCLLSIPCMATFAVTRRESGSWGWAFLQLGGLTIVAYLVTLFVQQTGRLLGIGTALLT